MIDTDNIDSVLTFCRGYSGKRKNTLTYLYDTVNDKVVRDYIKAHGDALPTGWGCTPSAVCGMVVECFSLTLGWAGPLEVWPVVYEAISSIDGDGEYKAEFLLDAAIYGADNFDFKVTPWDYDAKEPSFDSELLGWIGASMNHVDRVDEIARVHPDYGMADLIRAAMVAHRAEVAESFFREVACFCKDLD